jgi:hypothetical protein
MSQPSVLLVNAVKRCSMVGTPVYCARPSQNRTHRRAEGLVTLRGGSSLTVVSAISLTARTIEQARRFRRAPLARLFDSIRVKWCDKHHTENRPNLLDTLLDSGTF